MTHKEQRKLHAAITAKYLEGKTLQEFGDAIGRMPQEVHHWKVALQSPPAVLLYKLSLSSTADEWVVSWAEECLKVYLEEN